MFFRFPGDWSRLVGNGTSHPLQCSDKRGRRARDCASRKFGYGGEGGPRSLYPTSPVRSSARCRSTRSNLRTSSRYLNRSGPRKRKRRAVYEGALNPCSAGRRFMGTGKARTRRAGASGRPLVLRIVLRIFLHQRDHQVARRCEGRPSVQDRFMPAVSTMRMPSSTDISSR